MDTPTPDYANVIVIQSLDPERSTTPVTLDLLRNVVAEIKAETEASCGRLTAEFIGLKAETEASFERLTTELTQVNHQMARLGDYVRKLSDTFQVLHHFAIAKEKKSLVVEESSPEQLELPSSPPPTSPGTSIPESTESPKTH